MFLSVDLLRSLPRTLVVVSALLPVRHLSPDEVLTDRRAALGTPEATRAQQNVIGLIGCYGVDDDIPKQIATGLPTLADGLAFHHQIVRDALCHHRVLLVLGVACHKAPNPSGRGHELTCTQQFEKNNPSLNAPSAVKAAI